MQKRQKEARSGGEGATAGSQAVTVTGNKVAVAKALAALEAVLLKAECAEEIVVDSRIMCAPSRALSRLPTPSHAFPCLLRPLLIGRGGEEINRIRLETGAAIDGERAVREWDSTPAPLHLTAFPCTSPVSPLTANATCENGTVQEARPSAHHSLHPALE